jgi:hypothetical protein
MTANANANANDNAVRAPRTPEHDLRDAAFRDLDIPARTRRFLRFLTHGAPLECVVPEAGTVSVQDVRLLSRLSKENVDRCLGALHRAGIIKLSAEHNRRSAWQSVGDNRLSAGIEIEGTVRYTVRAPWEFV